jgi:hypothetical protein
MLVFQTYLASEMHHIPNRIEKNGMVVTWQFEKDLIHFQMSAPTTGWVTIGFNESSTIKNAYLLMGRVLNGKTEVVEHFTLSPGKYKPITELGGKTMVNHISGQERAGTSTIKFSLPMGMLSKYQKQLIKDRKYHMIMAFSREDDFQHHSIMRTSVEVQL